MSDRDHNAIFAGSQATTQQTVPGQQSQLDAIPYETIPVPSLGKVYSITSPLAGVETLDIRPMTARDEDILTSPALIKKGVVVTELLKSCLINKAINPLDMLVGDRNALLIAIRITGYGSEYPIEVVCPSCDHKFEHVFELVRLPIKQLELEPVVPNTNAFEFHLPVSKKRVVFRFMDGRIEEELTTLRERQKKSGSVGETNVTTSLNAAIVSIDGIDDKGKLVSMIRNMPARDSHALRNYIVDNEPGVTMKAEIDCPACGAVEEVGVPLGVSFLWPGRK